MDYRGYEFSVVQSAAPTGWVWTIRAGGEELLTGTMLSKVHATLAARRAIDRVVKARQRAAAENAT
jgi:hypothetical protein